MEEGDEPGPVGKVAIVQEELGARLVRVYVEVIDASRVEGRCASNQAMDLVSVSEKQFCEIRAVLTGDTGDERASVILGRPWGTKVSRRG